MKDLNWWHAYLLVKLRISDILFVFAIEISIIHNIRSRKLTCNKNHYSVIYNCRDRPFPSSVWWSLLKDEHRTKLVVTWCQNEIFHSYLVLLQPQPGAAGCSQEDSDQARQVLLFLWRQILMIESFKKRSRSRPIWIRSVCPLTRYPWVPAWLTSTTSPATAEVRRLSIPPLSLVQNISSLLRLPGLSLLFTSNISGQGGLLRCRGQLRGACVWPDRFW